MKIAFMAYDTPNYFGGPITNARRLLPELQKRGHEVHALIFYHQDFPSGKYLQSLGINCHVVNWTSYPYTETKIRWILNTIQTIQPDIFVPNISVSGYFASKWIRRSGIPTIAAHRSDDTFHWGMVDEFVIGDPQWAVSGLVCVSDYLKNRVEVLQPKYTKLFTIPSGVPIPQTISNQKGTVKIAYVGRLVQQQKRIRDVFEALVNLLKNYLI
jgi:colanic acid/amylovoran biosynthesis glycosyltransferase